MKTFKTNYDTIVKQISMQDKLKKCFKEILLILLVTCAMGCFKIKGQCKSRETLPWTSWDCTRFPWRRHVHRVCEIEVSITIFSRLTILLVMPRVADNGVRSAMSFFFSTVLMTPLTFTRRRLLVTNCSRHEHLSPRRHTKQKNDLFLISLFDLGEYVYLRIL